jgi:hypothetical protein
VPCLTRRATPTCSRRRPRSTACSKRWSSTLTPRVWGSKTEQADLWAAHDAVSLAAALEGLPLYVSYGTGEYGPLDEDENQDIADTEAWLFPQNEAFVARLE